MTTLTPEHAELIGLIIQSALYGLYTVLFIGCLYVPIRRHRSRHKTPINKILFGVTIILYLLITAHWILQCLRAIEGFILPPGKTSNVYVDASEKKNVAKTVLYILQTFVGDFTMIYRLFIVWGRDWRIILVPSLSSLGLLVAGSGASYSFAHLKPGQGVFVSSAGHWIIAVFVTTLVSNVLVTALLTYRIWSIDKKANKLVQRGNAMFVVQIILESAGLYTMSLIATHVGYLTEQTYQFAALDATSPIIGISFSLIIVRVGLGTSMEGHDMTLPSSMVNSSWSNHAARKRTTFAQDPIPLTEITVNINQEVISDDIESLKRNEDVYPDKSKGDARREEWHP